VNRATTRRSKVRRGRVIRSKAFKTFGEGPKKKSQGGVIRKQYGEEIRGELKGESE